VSEEKWRLVKDPPLPGETNMERDLHMLQEVAAGESPPVIRLYRWSPPAVSLGYFQKEAEVVDPEACRRNGIEVVRRPTGGRAILHYREVTYCLVIPENHPIVPAGIVESYRYLSRGLVLALEKLGLEPQLAPENKDPGKVVPGSCFDTPSDYELQVQQKKVVGSAQLRRNGVLLQHGSVLLELLPELNREVLLPPEGQPGKLSVRFLRKRAAGLKDLGLQVEEEELMQALEEGFASVLEVGS